MGLGQFALSGILGALAQPGLEPGEGTRAPTLQLPDRHAELPGDGVDRLTPQQAQHHLVLACQAPALTGRERTSPNCLPCDGRHRRAALALAAHKPSRIDHRLSITFHPVCPPASRDNTVSRETAGSSWVRVQRRDTASFEQTLTELLTLTKTNWNSTQFDNALPIT